MQYDLVPGAFVLHPDRPAWGVGQVQSVIGRTVTVNFEHRGKCMINNSVIGLKVIDMLGGQDGDAF